ncbi:MAG: penicillin-binding protein 2 [Thiobacillus sp. 63-78]|uniref:penicillin-binding protein 2 n=1 Tax=Thiobacillus sp. 63-78 TaxID=1895859 RepID=UPI000960D9C3|nr:penicillin-binding protein 2 [Thiobacillus sp. 63-78]MBN8763251.1 penicillin-binding protein 2 [Thiobacillus sp.]MBN8773007.1 penicillin-binding protein 2 [Thiobacillus sp.]OJZ14897.1 MAG: penicillin-binding protein 2 [Thiobacillus sp. 63-78]
MPLATTLKNLDRELARFHGRLKAGAIFVALLATTLLGRAFYLQITQHDYYIQRAENNRITQVPVAPNRGLILDRKGRILAENYSAYTLELARAQPAELEATLAEVSRLIEITPGELRRFRRLLAESHEFETVPLKSKLTDEEVAILAANRYRLPGTEVKARLFRNYRAGPGMAHVVGFIGRINDRDLKNLRETGREQNYRGTAHIGKTGLEQSYETLLHGRTGFDQMETDASGRAVRALSRIPPVPGKDLRLYLDEGLQAVAEHAFGDYMGGLVALDPNTGGVLALVSKPGFDPNLFIDGIDPETWKALNESPERPMVNRVLRGLYPPGSTIKPFMGLAGLELGLRKPGDTIVDPGYFSLPNSSHQYRDWKRGGHGIVDLRRAITQSCDTYFYKLAVDMGIDRMHDYLAHFSFGEKTGIDLDGESAGLLPSREWKQRRWKKAWYPGETVIAGIGQGYHLTTPLQLATATAMLANGGKRIEPRLVQAVRDPFTHVWQPQPVVVHEQVAIRPEDLAVVRQGMMDVMRPGGTGAAAAAGAAYTIAGKTGTAQVVGIKQGARYDAGSLSLKNRDHALFIAYAPAENPTIVVAVMVENGGHGGSTAGPIARAVFDYYLTGKRPGTLKQEGSDASD